MLDGFYCNKFACECVGTGECCDQPLPHITVTAIQVVEVDTSPRKKRKKTKKKKRGEEGRELVVGDLLRSDRSATLDEAGGEETALAPGGDEEEDSLDVSSSKTGVDEEEEEEEGTTTTRGGITAATATAHGTGEVLTSVHSSIV